MKTQVNICQQPLFKDRITSMQIVSAARYETIGIRNFYRIEILGHKYA